MRIMNGGCTIAWNGTDLHTIITRCPYRENVNDIIQNMCYVKEPIIMKDKDV